MLEYFLTIFFRFRPPRSPFFQAHFVVRVSGAFNQTLSHSLSLSLSLMHTHTHTLAPHPSLAISHFQISSSKKPSVCRGSVALSSPTAHPRWHALTGTPIANTVGRRLLENRDLQTQGNSTVVKSCDVFCHALMTTATLATLAT